MAKYSWLIVPLVLVGCSKPVVPDDNDAPAPVRRASTPKQVFIDYSKRGPADLKLEQKQAHAEGIPLTEGELTPPIPPAENAAPLYLKAIALRKTLNPPDAIWKGLNLTKIENAADAATAEKCLQVAKPVLALLSQAARRPACQFSRAAIAASNAKDVAFVKAFAEAAGNKPNPHADALVANDDVHIPVAMKELARLAVLDAQLTNYRGRPVDALHSLAAYAPMCGHLKQGPEVIAELEGTSIELTLLKEISHILSHHGREPDVAEAASNALPALGPDPDLARLAEGESLRAQLDTFPAFKPAKGEKPGKEKYNENDDERLGRLAFRPGMIEEWRALELEQTRKLVSIYRNAGDNWTKLASEVNSAAESYSTPTDDAHAYFHSMEPKPGAYIELHVQARSQRRVLAQAAAIFVAWIKTGKLPDTLPLTGLTAKDPLSNNNLHYSHTSDGFTIYGVGPGGIDHGGRPRPQKGESGSYDIVFTYPAPAPQPPQPPQSLSHVSH